MGSLTPGARYIYERNGDEIYAREEGKLERKLVGYNLPHTPNPRDPLDYRHYMSDQKEAQLWRDINLAAKENEELQKVLERAKIIYYLSKKESGEEPPMWHPV